ncbi:hypothetical protein LTR12_015473 [Friedmanniomyces endolithicus]|nr:hypothetical protein LTR12_015473 [Friedmanniomyces endolithicus]
MALHSVLHALLVLLTLSIGSSATPLLNRQTNQSTSNLSVPNAGHLTCSTESYPDLERSCVLASIEHFCHDHVGYQFPANAYVRSLLGLGVPYKPDMDFYYYFSKDVPWPRKAYFNVATLQQPFHWTFWDCFSLVHSLGHSCEQWGLINGGSDADSKNSWLIDNDPDLHRPGQVPDQSQWIQGRDLAVKSTREEARAEPADRPADTAITPYTPLNNTKRQTMSECFQTGYQFPLSAWNEGLDIFCGWADGRMGGPSTRTGRN